jgi:hypothetical protein
VRREWLRLAGVVGVAFAVGCDRTTPTTPVSVSHPQAVIDEADDKNAEPPIEPVEPAPPPDEQPPPEPPPAERIALLTPGGPVLVDVRLSLDGQPVGAALDALVEETLAAADTDLDGDPTWRELAANQEYLANRMTENEGDGPSQLDMWTERHDVNRDGRLQAEEAAAWLGRGADRTARAFALRTSRAYSPDPRNASRVWPLLDADEDGRLAADEIDAAGDRLLSLDANDDRVIAAGELASLRDQLAGGAAPAPRSSRLTSRLAALHLDASSDLERVDYILQDMYAPLQDLGPESFPAAPGLFAALDADGDEWLARSELANLRTTPSQLELSVVFQSSPPGADTPATIRVDRRADEIAVIGDASTSRIMLALGATRLILSAHDLTPPDEETVDAVSRSQLRLMVHDLGDALFGELDANADGRLSEREISSAAAHLRACDADGDSLVAAAELPYAMIVAFLRAEPPGGQSFYVPAAPQPPSAAEAPAWFAAADLNQDGDVSSREFLGSAAQFASLDANADGFVDAPEAGNAIQRSP